MVQRKHFGPTELERVKETRKKTNPSNRGNRSNCLSLDYQITAPHGTVALVVLWMSLVSLANETRATSLPDIWNGRVEGVVRNTKFALHDSGRTWCVFRYLLATEARATVLPDTPLTTGVFTINCSACVRENFSVTRQGLRCPMLVSRRHKKRQSQRLFKLSRPKKAETFPLPPSACAGQSCHQLRQTWAVGQIRSSLRATKRVTTCVDTCAQTHGAPLSSKASGCHSGADSTLDTIELGCKMLTVIDTISSQ